MVAPIVPFVVGILGNLAQRKEDRKAIDAATAKQDHDTMLAYANLQANVYQSQADRTQEMKLQRMANWQANNLEWIKASKGSMFPGLRRDMGSIMLGDSFEHDPTTVEGPLMKYFPLLQKLSGFRI